MGPSRCAVPDSLPLAGMSLCFASTRSSFDGQVAHVRIGNRWIALHQFRLAVHADVGTGEVGCDVVCDGLAVGARLRVHIAVGLTLEAKTFCGSVGVHR